MKNGTLVIGTSVDKKGFRRDLQALEEDVKKYGNIGAGLIDESQRNEEDRNRNLKIADELADEITQGFDDGFSNAKDKLIGQEWNASQWFAEDVADGLLEGFNNGYDEAKTLTEEVAKDISEDLADGVKEGITEGVEEAKDEVEDFGGKTDSVFSKVFSKLGSKFKSTITRAISSASSIGATLVKILKVAGISAGALGIGIGAIVLLIGPLVAGIYIVIQAFKKVMEENEQLKTDIQYIIWAFQKALEPAVNYVAGIVVGILKTVIKIIQYVAVLIQRLTGKNIFDNASAQAFADHLAEAKENADGVGGSLKQIKKQLAGFDEMNVLNDSGGGAGLANADFTTPSIDLSDLGDAEKEIDEFALNTIKAYNKVRKEVKESPFESWFEKFGDWGLLVYGLNEILTALGEVFFGMILQMGGAWEILTGIFTGDFEKIGKGFKTLLLGMQMEFETFATLLKGILDVILGFILGVVSSIWQWITTTIMSIYEDIEGSLGAVEKVFGKTVADSLRVFIESGKEALGFANEIFESVKSIFKNIIKFFDSVFKGDWKSAWDTLVSIAKNIFYILEMNARGLLSNLGSIIKLFAINMGDSIKSIINSVLTGIENMINAPIDMVNNLAGKLKKLGLNVGTFGRIKIPRLAKGGIVSMPGRGVPVGSAIAGERGQEAVLPLTDSQQMALLGETIGKYITINNYITNKMNSRTISRELQITKGESNFAFNR